jgi:hypothetical protein
LHYVETEQIRMVLCLAYRFGGVAVCGIACFIPSKPIGQLKFAHSLHDIRT